MLAPTANAQSRFAGSLAHRQVGLGDLTHFGKSRFHT